MDNSGIVDIEQLKSLLDRRQQLCMELSDVEEKIVRLLCEWASVRAQFMRTSLTADPINTALQSLLNDVCQLSRPNEDPHSTL